MNITVIPLLLNLTIVFATWTSDMHLPLAILFAALAIAKLISWFAVVLNNEIGAVLNIGWGVCFVTNAFMIINSFAAGMYEVAIPYLLTFVVLSVWTFASMCVSKEKKEGRG